ncbi:MAG TPA: hypothetical protein VFQ61_09695 [Polyangiaceae bacterium]|nr:hypothetical protein [Polyangiaceae bacterium]
MCCVTALFITHASPSFAQTNLLAGKSAIRSQGMKNARALTDEAKAPEGDEWNTSAAAIIGPEQGFIEFDLGQSETIKAAYLQGDNNDEYLLTVSEDRKTYAPLWTAPTTPEAGLRERFTDQLNARGRYVRLTARGGDRSYSVTELQLFSSRPAKFPPGLRIATGQAQNSLVRTQFMYLGFAFFVLLFGTFARSKAWVIGLLGLGVAVAAYLAYQSVEFGWPLASREVAFARATAAAIALFAVCRVALPAKRWPAHRRIVAGSLMFSAALALAAFYNLGRPQFWNHQEGRPTFVHTYDMRVYQPFAKYFHELRYDGVYPASVLTYAEDVYGGSLEPMARVEVRSLKDHKARRVADVKDEMLAIKQRFTPERWEALRQDMKYFREVMGPEFIGTLTDHGANATPVWVFFARLFLGHTSASDGVLTIAGLADAALFLLLGIAMWRTFGLLPALAALTVLGALDLYMFGTNWTGATLRHDWMAFLGFAACSLKAHRFRLAGVFMALAALIRAFPVVALFGVALPAIWWVAETWRKEGKPPTIKRILERHKDAVRVLLSAAACVAVAIAVTSALYSFESWLQWWQKVTLLNRDVGVNEVSLRALVAGVDSSSARAGQARFLILGSAKLLCVVLVAIACRKRPLYQAMLLSLPLVQVMWNPSNYYSHFIFLLVLLGSGATKAQAALAHEDEAARVEGLPLRLLQSAGPLLGLCIAGYWISLEPDLDRHFQDTTVTLFVALGWLMANVWRTDPAVRAFLKGEPTKSEPSEERGPRSEPPLREDADGDEAPSSRPAPVPQTKTREAEQRPQPDQQAGLEQEEPA